MAQEQIYTHRTYIDKFKQPSSDFTGYASDDYTWTDEFIIKDFLDIRANIVIDSLSLGMDLSHQMVQTLGCVEVEEHDRSECPCTPPSGCFWLRTLDVLPEFLRITSVTGIVVNKQMPRFSFITWDRLRYIPEARTASAQKALYWTVRDSGAGRHLYLYGGEEMMQKIAISGIWANPMEAAAYPSCGKRSVQAVCNPLDTPIYTDKTLINKILTTAWQKLLPVRQTAPSDLKNNDQPKP